MQVQLKPKLPRMFFLKWDQSSVTSISFTYCSYCTSRIYVSNGNFFPYICCAIKQFSKGYKDLHIIFSIVLKKFERISSFSSFEINCYHLHEVLLIFQGSSFVTQPSESYELYLTAAATNAVKLWDMRTSRWQKQNYHSKFFC